MKTENIVYAALASLLLLAGAVGATQDQASQHANEAAMEHANQHSGLSDEAEGAVDDAQDDASEAADHAADKMCGEWRNHGDYVSEQAKEDGNNSAAGQSDIGKCTPDDNETAEPDEDDSEDGTHGRSEGRGDERGRSEDARGEHPPHN
jgi:hypothetical protein